MKRVLKKTHDFILSGYWLLAVSLVILLPNAIYAATFNIANEDVLGLVTAINTANGNGESDIINLAPSGTYILTTVNNTYYYSGPNGLPTITSKISINGNGATIQRSSVTGTPDFRIFMIYGDLTLNEVTISGGRSAQGAPGYTGGGGGLRIDRGKLQLVNSTITGNSGSNIVQGTGGNDGGGILNFSGGILTVVNSTISYNTGYGGRCGGGILNLSSGGYNSKATIINSTIYENRADGPSGMQGRGDAIADSFSPPGSISLKNSIIASPSNGLGIDMFYNPGYPIPWSTLGHNIVSDAPSGLNGIGDMINTNPMLGAMADNGGPTHTHSILPGSPALDAVPIADCSDENGNPITIDQRGVSRPQGMACDIGSFELDAIYLPSTLTIQPNANCGKDALIGDYNFNGTNYLDRNFGCHDDFSALAWTASGLPTNGRSLLEFDLAQIPIGTSVGSAYLHLYSHNSLSGNAQSNGTGNVLVQKITQSWDEFSVTWNNQPAVTNYLTLSPILYGQDLTINITDAVQDWIDNPGSNHGLLFRQEVESYYRSMLFASSDEQNSAKHPKLVINFTSNVSFNATSCAGKPKISTSGPLSFCPGGSVTLISSSATGNYWSTGETTQSITVSNSGDYTVTVSYPCGSSISEPVTVAIEDIIPPTIAVSVNLTSLWPPNNQMKTITATVTVDDNCNGVTYVLTSITSNEDIINDVVNAAFGTNDLSFDLRAKRDGNGNGRIYTITYTATDASGNTATATASVSVPHNNKSALTDGSEYDGIVNFHSYPNPFTDETTIEFTLPTQSIISVKVYNLQGDLINTLHEGMTNAGLQMLKLSTENFPAGEYTVVLTVGSEQFIHKVMKVK